MQELYMRRCFELAQRAKGATLSNPMVGAVLVHNNRIIGEGWHRQHDTEKHAEVNCLESVADEDRGLITESTMYVNLEPCSHYGKTPPCSLRLVEEKVKEVIISNVDPYEEVRGRGIKMLADNHIVTSAGLLKEAGSWVNRRFFCFHTRRRPYIILKWAQTQQGYFAPLNRSRYQLSNSQSRDLVHKWRTEEAAIMVGHKTALADNPQLTSRYWKGAQPLRIVLDRRLALPHSLNVFNDEAPTWVINEEKNAQQGNISYIKLSFDEILLTRIMEKLYDAGKLSLIVEGGAALLQSFMNLGLWDEARVFHTENLLQDGIMAPTLKTAKHIMQTGIDSDTLHVYVNDNSPYKYAEGLPL